MTTRLLLVRHGETVWNVDEVYRGRADVPLSDMGKRQAELLGRRLQHEGVTALRASPLVRAAETAAAIGRRTGVAVEVDSDLNDLDCGEWEGLSDRESRRKYPDLRQRWLSEPHLVRLPGGSRSRCLGARSARARAALRIRRGRARLAPRRPQSRHLTLLGLDNSTSGTCGSTLPASGVR